MAQSLGSLRVSSLQKLNSKDSREQLESPGLSCASCKAFIPFTKRDCKKEGAPAVILSKISQRSGILLKKDTFFHLVGKLRKRGPLRAKSPPDSEGSYEPTYRVLKLKDTGSNSDSSKLDTTDDAVFYERPRFVQHADDSYVEKLTDVYKKKLRKTMRVLDLMSSWTSHLPNEMQFQYLEGHGMNEAELLANKRLDRFWVQDLNKDPVLMHDDGAFDAVLISLGIQYLEWPLKVLQEVRRVLAPGGLLIVSFSRHSYKEKAVAGWLRRSNEERLELVKFLLQDAGFESVELEVSAKAVKNEDLHPASDPFYALIATKSSTETMGASAETPTTYDSLSLQTLSTTGHESDNGADGILLQTWLNAYEAMAKEAQELGIPKHAIPQVQEPLSKESITQARDLLSGIIESRMSSNL